MNSVEYMEFLIWLTKEEDYYRRNNQPKELKVIKSVRCELANRMRQSVQKEKGTFSS